jgi:hypothetical protein
MSIVVYMVCESHEFIYHLHLYVHTFYTYTYIVANGYTYFLHLHGKKINICQMHLHNVV